MSSQKDCWKRSHCDPVGAIVASDRAALICTVLVKQLHASTSYQFRVTAKNHKGSGPPSVASALVMTDCALPAPVTDVAVWRIGTDHVILRISPPPAVEDAPILEYRIESCRSGSSGPWMPADAQLDDSDRACAHATLIRVDRLSASTEYRFRAIAVNRKGFGMASNPTIEVKTAGADWCTPFIRSTGATFGSSLCHCRPSLSSLA